MYSSLKMKDKLFLACAVSNQLLLQSSLQALCPHTEEATHTPDSAEKQKGELCPGTLPELLRLKHLRGLNLHFLCPCANW